MEHESALIGNDGELIVPDEITDPRILPYLPDLFLADDDHEVLLFKKSEETSWFDTIKRNLLGVIVISILTYGIIFYTIMLSAQEKKLGEVLIVSTLTWLAALIVLPVVIWIFLHALALKEDILYQDGKLLVGHVTRYKPRNGGHDLIDYQFTTPSGREINVHATVKRSKRSVGYNTQNPGQSVPTVGTPVAVLYLDDQYFKLL